ncbi:bifunctional serine/threonine-protein kinase/ABC transporter substrate-binding protein [Streptomyces hoynatensis]|uniref:bifunctional serine/threonine-protein kinase/ABC transporter substrate-binding protein n=1 Tax=Streptomyces hoynatensis TaxID=1141874 RepID=UPI00131A246A|nr:bifunctional serine/threonine-protein kinase/ABC transporter substrate-binding protein [Streptomyces hoynatensis]
MRELEPADPRRIGGYRLVRRLAEGRTGVVYLARSLGGLPVALKLVRAQYALDPGFRARLARDVAATAGVSHRYLVPLLASDTTGGTVWAASPYVPGPTLTAAVTAHGALPADSVRALGGMLAQALDAVHAAGVAHRDVRPGHVLLLPDGPRLTGFGATGTREEPTAPGGAAKDVFALGWVLAYAAAGRAPFGKGGRDPAAAPREEPADLADVPRALLEVLQACLERDPELRPTAAELIVEFARPAGAGPWLPGPLARELAARLAARVPEPEQEPAAGTPPAARPGPPAPEEPPARRRPWPVPRRRVLALLGGGGALLAAGAAAARLLRTPGGAAAAGRRRFAIGLHADLTGRHAAFGESQKNGITLALEESGELGGLPFEVGLHTVDDGGDPARAVAAAGELAADREVLAVIGPTADEVARPAALAYAEAGLPLLALSVGGFEPREGLGTLLHARPNTRSVGLAIPGCLAEEVGPRRVGVIDDRAAGTYSRQTTQAARGAFDPEDVELLPYVLPTGTEDFGEVAGACAAAGVEAVVYGGFARGAGRLARALREAGYTGASLATEQALHRPFFEEAGAAADGWYFLTAYTDAAFDSGTRGFDTVYRRRFVRHAGPYAAEAYDAALMVLEAMRGLLAAGQGLTRGRLLTRLRAAGYHGIARDLAFDAVGDYAGRGPMAYLYRVSEDEVSFRGPVRFPAS